MIHFPVLRSKRLTVQLRELSIIDSIALAKMPEHFEQTAVTAFLKAAISETNQPDVSGWTIAERNLVICHYLSAVTDDGPNFAIGEGRYTDYLDGENDHVTDPTLSVEVGELGNDAWMIRHLTGHAAETIERLQGAIEGISGRLHWILGAMAAQMVRKGEDAPALFDEEWLLNRMKIMAAYPESDFITLLFLHQTGAEQLHHLFRFDFDDDGVLILPAQEESELPPARFRIRACLSLYAQRVAGEPGESGQ